MRSRHCAAECRLDRWSSCIRSMSDLGQSAVLTVRRPLPAFPHKQTFSGSVGMSQRCQRIHAARQIESLFDHFVGAREHLRGEPYCIWGSQLAGFGLRVKASGTKTFKNS